MILTLLAFQMGPGDLLQLLTYFFTTGGIPFLQVENAYFVRFVEILVSLAPGCTFKLPKRTSFMTEVCKEMEVVRKQVETEVQVSDHFTP
jgi:hypothetical protein